MAIKSEKLLQNVSGKFYVTEACLACEVCQTLAPNNFRYAENMMSYVFMQPGNAEEERQCELAADGCPMEAIGMDGDMSD